VHWFCKEPQPYQTMFADSRAETLWKLLRSLLRLIRALNTLNIHWFCDKLDLTGSKIQFYNGIALLVTFFGCRIVWGTYQSVLIYSDIYTALTTSPSDPLASMLDEGKCENNASSISPGYISGCEIGGLPMWLVSIYLVGNTALSLLNFYWFSQMVKAIRKRFVVQSGVQVNKQTKKGQ
jgi:hypothetical protein